LIQQQKWELRFNWFPCSPANEVEEEGGREEREAEQKLKMFHEIIIFLRLFTFNFLPFLFLYCLANLLSRHPVPSVPSISSSLLLLPPFFFFTVSAQLLLQNKTNNGPPFAHD